MYYCDYIIDYVINFILTVIILFLQTVIFVSLSIDWHIFLGEMFPYALENEWLLYCRESECVHSNCSKTPLLLSCKWTEEKVFHKTLCVISPMEGNTLCWFELWPCQLFSYKCYMPWNKSWQEVPDDVWWSNMLSSQTTRWIDRWACLHQVTSCLFSDPISIWLLKRFRLHFNFFHLCKFNGVHVNEGNRYALHFINYQLISISETATGESAASALER